MGKSFLTLVFACLCLTYMTKIYSQQNVKKYYHVHDEFAFKGPHAAIGGVGAGTFTTVWADEDVWDARVAHSFVTMGYGGHHIDIHKTCDAQNLLDGRICNNTFAIGGDDTPGILTMHMHGQGVVSSRLRNPLLLKEPNNPAHIRFYAPRNVTTGAWWEIAVTPNIAGAEHTAIPSTTTPIPSPIRTANYATPGPGILTPQDSFNIIYAGAADVCDGAFDNRGRIAMSLSHNRLRTHWPSIADNVSELPKTFEDDGEDMHNEDVLMRVEIFIHAQHIIVAFDYDDDGLDDYQIAQPVVLPWGQAYVHLLGVTYQPWQHPQDNCNRGTEHKIKWRDFYAYPVKYAKTQVVYHETLINDGQNNIARSAQIDGWRYFDMRDTMRGGVKTVGATTYTQPNIATWRPYAYRAYCDTSLMWPCNRPKSATLNFNIADIAKIADAKIIYDIRAAFTQNEDATFAINSMQNSVVNYSNFRLVGPWRDEYIRRSADAMKSAFKNGANTLGLTVRGKTELDRVEIELYMKE